MASPNSESALRSALYNATAALQNIRTQLAELSLSATQLRNQVIMLESRVAQLERGE